MPNTRKKPAHARRPLKSFLKKQLIPFERRWSMSAALVNSFPVTKSLFGQSDLPFCIVAGTLGGFFQNSHVEKIGHGNDQPCDGMSTPKERHCSVIGRFRTTFVTLPIIGTHHRSRRRRRGLWVRHRWFSIFVRAGNGCRNASFDEMVLRFVLARHDQADLFEMRKI